MKDRKTYNERLEVSNEFCDMFIALDDAHSFLTSLCEIQFSGHGPFDTHVSDPDFLLTSLYMVADSIYAILLEWWEKTGDSEWRGDTFHVDRAKKFLEVREVGELHQKAVDKKRTLSGPVKDAFFAERIRIGALTDAEAVPALKALLSSTES